MVQAMNFLCFKLCKWSVNDFIADVIVLTMQVEANGAVDDVGCVKLFYLFNPDLVLFKKQIIVYLFKHQIFHFPNNTKTKKWKII